MWRVRTVNRLCRGILTMTMGVFEEFLAAFDEMRELQRRVAGGDRQAFGRMMAAQRKADRLRAAVENRAGRATGQPDLFAPVE